VEDNYYDYQDVCVRQTLFDSCQFLSSMDSLTTDERVPEKFYYV